MKYQCSMCKGIFESGWSDDEARAEHKEVFGEAVAALPAEVVCDDCYKKFRCWLDDLLADEREQMDTEALAEQSNSKHGPHDG